MHGQNQIDIKFGINDYDGGSTVPNYFERSFFDGWTGSEPSYQQIFELDAAGTNKAAINSGDIIELGFFDTDNVTVTGDSQLINRRLTLQHNLKFIIQGYMDSDNGSDCCWLRS